MSIWLRLLVTLLLASELTSCGSSAVPVTLERTTATGIHQKVAEHKGRKAVLVNFWATWCAPCGEEFPLIADLKLRDVGGKEVCLSDVAGPGGLVVIFSCNTCPWVIAWEDRYVKLATAYQPKGVGFVAVNSNEAYRGAIDDNSRRPGQPSR